MFSFFKKKSLATTDIDPAKPAQITAAGAPGSVLDDASTEPKTKWLHRLKSGLARTGAGIAQVFVGARIDDALYEELEAALLMADTGVSATAYLLDELKRRVKESNATDADRVKALLVDTLTDMLKPLEKPLTLGEFKPTVMMVVGVNGAGKTTSIGKLTRYLAQADKKVLLAAADKIGRASCRERVLASV